MRDTRGIQIKSSVSSYIPVSGVDDTWRKKEATLLVIPELLLPPVAVQEYCPVIDVVSPHNWMVDTAYFLPLTVCISVFIFTEGDDESVRMLPPGFIQVTDGRGSP